MDLAEAQAIADITAKHLGMKARPVVSFKDIKDNGLAYYTQNRIELSNHMMETSGDLFITYVIAHEVCHFLPNCHNHSRKYFKKAEDKALAFWNIGIQRKTIYAERLWKTVDIN